jgi:hypothetical protein
MAVQPKDKSMVFPFRDREDFELVQRQRSRAAF